MEYLFRILCEKFQNQAELKKNIFFFRKKKTGKARKGKILNANFVFSTHTLTEEQTEPKRILLLLIQ